LKEARNAFLNDFLQPQIKMVCQNLGFRDYPKARFEEVDIKDEVQLQRVVTRLLELGILTPEQGIDAIKTGIYPRPDELSPAQDDYSEERRQGKFNPLVGGVPMMEPEGGDPAIGPSGKEQGRPTGTKGIPQENASLISRKDIQEVIYKAESLSSFVKKSLRSKLKKRKLTKLQDETADDLCESIICSTDIEDWESVAEACVTDNEKIADLKDKKEIIEIGIEKELQLYPSALYYHSKRRQEDD
jgi:hypothetical protein